jgi:Domain of unknown function (DUF1772)
MLIGHLALTIAALFTGAAIYVSAAEQPARLRLDDRALLTEWKPSYKRGAVMQASLALLAFLLGMIAWWQTGKIAFLIGALFMLTPWPWTVLVIKPTNDALLAADPVKADDKIRALIVNWGRLHLVRTFWARLPFCPFCMHLRPIEAFSPRPPFG